VKVAVLGLGSAGARHASNLLELGHEVVGFDPVAPPHDGRVERAGSLEAALDRADAVVVASPSSLHAEQALAVLEQGRHVLVEKPLAVNVADAERVVEAAGRAGTVCGVAMNLRFHPALVELRRLLADGALGSVRFVQASFGYDLRLWHPGSDYRTGYSARADLGGGIVLDAIHELDYLLWLFGPVESVVAEVAHISDLELDVEDVAVAALRFASGAVAAVDLNFFEPAYRRGCILVGSQAVARWDWSRATVTVSREGEDDGVVDVACDLADTYRAEIVDFLAAVAGGGEPRATVLDGLAAVRLAQALKSAADEGRRVVLQRS
jgi:predicted dehydrogenase